MRKTYGRVATMNTTMSEFSNAGAPAGPGPAGLLSLAASPVFAIMALLTAVSGGGRTDMLCAAVHAASPLGGMVSMYLLMSLFHSAPWLKLILAGRWS